jgi:hypothetical protein
MLQKAAFPVLYNDVLVIRKKINPSMVLNVLVLAKSSLV